MVIYLMGVYVMSIYLINVYVMSVCLISMHLTGVPVTESYLMRVSHRRVLMAVHLMSVCHERITHSVWQFLGWVAPSLLHIYYSRLLCSRLLPSSYPDSCYPDSCRPGSCYPDSRRPGSCGSSSYGRTELKQERGYYECYCGHGGEWAEQGGSSMIRRSRRHGRWATTGAVIIQRFCKFIAVACMALWTCEAASLVLSLG